MVIEIIITIFIVIIAFLITVAKVFRNTIGIHVNGISK